GCWTRSARASRPTARPTARRTRAATPRPTRRILGRTRSPVPPVPPAGVPRCARDASCGRFQLVVRVVDDLAVLADGDPALGGHRRPGRYAGNMPAPEP